MLPIDMIGLGRILQDTNEPEERRIVRVKSHVLKHLAIKTSGGETVLMEVSSETFTYERDVPWLISYMSRPLSCDNHWGPGL